MTLPMLLITRWLGLDAAAVWAVATRPFFILRQILNRPFQYGISMLAELFARGSRDVMIHRWMQLSQLMTASALALFPVVMFNNNSFLALWTKGKISWMFGNDLLFAIYSFLLVALFPWYGIVGIDKKYGITRFTSILEAVVLTLLCFLTVKKYCIQGIIASLIIGKLVIALIPSLINLYQVFGNEVKKVFYQGVIRPLFAAPICLFQVWLITIVAQPYQGWLRFIMSIFAGTAVSLLTVFLLGLSIENRNYFLNISGIIKK
jgi:hypothetical protein